MIRALLPQAPLGANLILDNQATVQLICDCYFKTEPDDLELARGSDTVVSTVNSGDVTAEVLNLATAGNARGVQCRLGEGPGPGHLPAHGGNRARQSYRGEQHGANDRKVICNYGFQNLLTKS